MRLLAAALLLAATPAGADTLVVNANGYTLDLGGKLVRLSGLVVDDTGRIARVLKPGDKEPAAKLGDFRLDAAGRTLLPGLIDAHGHVMALGEAAATVDLTGARSLDEALARVRAYAAANPRRRWITGRGWNQVTWGTGFPTAADLDRAVPDRPVALARVDGHALWLNSAALAASGITARTKDPPGGRVERDARGAPAGVLVDADALVRVPPATPEEQEAQLARALTILASVGLTGVHDMGVTPETWRLYRLFGDEGRLTMRVTAAAAGIEALDAIAPTRPTPFLYDDRLVLRTVKLYADGALGSRGAWLKAPYSDDPGNTGLRFHDDAKLRNLISKANFLGFQAAVHAIGDAANAQVLDAFAELRPTYGDTPRNRVEHAQVVDPADLPRFGELKVIASVQPTHATSDKAMAGDRLGEARLAGAYAWRTLGATTRLAFGSDFPVEPPDPFFGIHAAVTRQDRDGQPPGGWRPGEAVTREQALAGFTTGAAWAGFAETKVGRLAPGLWADFILVDRDPFAIEPADLWKTQVLETWLAGRRVFVRAAAGAPPSTPPAQDQPGQPQPE